MSDASGMRLGAITLAELPCRTRLPFRFGAVTVTAAPLLHCRVEIETRSGSHGVGMAADLLMPRWFRKDIERSATADQQALRASVERAATAYRAVDHGSPFDIWERTQHELVESEPPATPDLLERGFGIALIERAMLDAACRAHDLPFHTALTNGVLGRTFARPTPPRTTMAVRHTVGRLDPLRSSGLAPADRLDDGMPVALDEVLRQHGVQWLKVKIGGGHDADVARLLDLAELLEELDRTDVRLTLDGNEQLPDLAALRELWAATAVERRGRDLLERVSWVEQPLPRNRFHVAITPDEWSACPLLLDEADCQRRTFKTGDYQGVSVKNCKGVFRALLNAEFAAAHPGRFQSSEDLTNQPVLSVQQDLVTASVLDLPHTERNGHHYFPGLDHLPEAVVEQALADHPDLYERTATSARLRIENGQLCCNSLHGPGYGSSQGVIDTLDRELDWQPL
ncbi:MAG: hypothetical protein NXI31_19100 [bacterium]|nr:hypothetical protein [bacterium]